ncbi:lipocalin family protein [Lacinutrix sp.]|uniref:lipocalin family protein n=1 Tax=Lacinutrix sp. TaxID=1937692 RepID=UPI0025C1A74A|nr:lipocalin family protein [Lacinutrix sp.]
MKNISKVSVLFMMVFAFAIMACDNEPLDGFDLNNLDGSNNLIGTWTLTNFDATVNTASEVGGIPFETDFLIQSVNPNYDLTFAPSTFTTSGSYGYDVNITVNGQTSMQNLSVDNVMGAGSYTTNGSEITSDGSFVSYEFQGMDLSEFDGPQTAPYTISADGQTLSFVQNSTETTNDGGFTTTSTISSSSTWTKINNTVDPCIEATSFASSAETAFNNDITNENLCNAYKSALQNQINSCGDNNGSIQALINGLGDCSNSTPDEGIVGTWLLTAWNGEEAIDLNNDGTENINFLDEMDCLTNETIVFNADNTGTVMSTSFPSFTTEIEVGTTDSFIFTIDCEEEVENTDITWTQNGNIISITDTATAGVTDWTINGNELSIIVPEGFVAFDGEDFTATVTQDLTFVYEKQ